ATEFGQRILGRSSKESRHVGEERVRDPSWGDGSRACAQGTARTNESRAGSQEYRREGPREGTDRRPSGTTSAAREPRARSRLERGRDDRAICDVAERDRSSPAFVP